MNHQEKNIYASLITTVIVYAFYITKINWMYIDGRFSGSEGTSLLGKAILIYIAVSIVTHIVVNIIFTVANSYHNKICTAEIIDERDKLFELKTMKISFTIFGLCFCCSIVALALGSSTFWVINLIVFGFAFGDTIGNFVKLYYYRKGL
jgi:hypothetical protein